MPLDSARWSGAFDAMGGGGFHGFHNLALLLLPGRKVSPEQRLRAVQP